MQPICFGRYVLLDRIAAGGMGEVYLAVPRTLWGFEKFFAIKKVLPALGRDPEFLGRFRDEARIVIPMNHPNVVQVLEVGRVEEDYFIAMELVDGQSLGQLLERAWKHRFAVPLPAALYMIRELAAGLEYCHRGIDGAGRRLGMVHRDVCPSNVLVSYEGQVKLADFGLALSSLKAYHTKPNLVLGHLGYIAPEALDGERQDHRGDIFSAGVLLFELLTGQRFCTEVDLAAARREMRRKARTRISRLRAGVPASVDELVQRAVAWDPEERYQHALAFHDELQRQLVKIDALFGAPALGEKFMQRLFDVPAHRQRLRQLLRSLDMDEIEARQPAGRTFCIGEAIPLAASATRRPFGDGAAVLTLIEEPPDADTQPVEIGSAAKSPPRVSAPRRRRARWLTPVPSLSREAREARQTREASGPSRRLKDAKTSP